MNQPTASPAQTLGTIGLNDAAEAFGISVDTLRRRIKKEKLPEAVLAQGKFGETYELPMADLVQIAEREGWTLDLNALDAESSPAAAHMQSIVDFDVVEQLADAKASALSSSRHVEELDRKLIQTQNDLEHETTAHHQTASELTEVSKAKAVAEARVEELRQRAEQAEKLRAEVVQERDSLGLEHRELQKVSAESISALSSDLEVAQNDVTATVGERDELSRKLEAAEASMGWWTRRKYGRQ